MPAPSPSAAIKVFEHPSKPSQQTNPEASGNYKQILLQRQKFQQLVEQEGVATPPLQAEAD